MDLFGFACPRWALDTALMHSIVVGHAHLLVESFTQASTVTLTEHSHGLLSTLCRWTPDNTAFDAVWDISFGELRAASPEHRIRDCVRHACNVALRLHQFGLEGEWKACLDAPAVFRFGRWILQAETSLSVVARDGCVSVTTRCGNELHRISFWRNENCSWLSDVDPSFSELRHDGVRWSVIPSDLLPCAITERLLDADDCKIGVESWAPSRGPRFLSSCNGALDLIGNFAGDYLGWVKRAVRAVVPLPLIAGVLSSSSSSSAPGLITVTDASDIRLLAEMIVHEASHQYLYILSRLGALHDNTDTKLYFSPFRKTGRPILYILFAYHAFGNLLLFYRDLLQNGLNLRQDKLDLEMRTNELLQDLDVVEIALQSTQALTPLGHALWQPLREKVRATGNA